MRIVFMGPPGTGKGTQARRLALQVSVPHLSTGDLLRDAIQDDASIGPKASAFIDAGKLVPDELVQGILWRRLSKDDCGGGFLLDGFPRTKSQAEAIDEFLEQSGKSLDFVLDLSTPEPELLRRLAKRGRQDDEVAVIKKRLEVYVEQTRPLVEYYGSRGLYREIDGRGEPDEVYNRILSAISGAR